MKILETRPRKNYNGQFVKLHVNEFPFRHLFQKLDGKTVTLNGFSRPIRKQLEKCENMEITQCNEI